MLLTRQIARFVPKIIFRNYQVTVLGGANEVGQTVSLLLKIQKDIKKLVIFDEDEKTQGIVTDLSHIPTHTGVQGYTSHDYIETALKNADIIIVTGKAIKKPGLSQKDMFNENVTFIKKTAAMIAKISPTPFVGFATEPLNSLFPMAVEVMRNNGEYNRKKIFGITTDDLLRAQAVYATECGIDPNNCFLPVIGGHSDRTMIPLISQANPKCELDETNIRELTNKIRKTDDMDKEWAPTLSVAQGVVCFAQSIIQALEGEVAVVNALIENNDFGTSYFSGLVNVDQNGSGEMKTYKNLSEYECSLLEQSIEQLRKDVSIGKKILELA